MTEIIVYIPIDICSNLGLMMEWSTEQGIKIKSARARHSDNDFGRSMIYGYAFYFDDEDDAVAFKLRWR